MNKLAISIVAYKTPPSLIRNCVECINSNSNKFFVTLVDNSPSDSLRILAEELSVRYIHLPDNPGYGAGHNVAIRNSLERGVKYHLVLNADVEFLSDALNDIIKYMDIHSTVAHLMPKVLNADGSIQRLCKLVPTPIDLIVRRFLPNFISVRMRRRFELWNSGYNKVAFVPYLSGCFMFLRCSALKEVGIFDERFFMYPEDIDLTRRVALKYDTIFFPNVEVVHLHGAASYKSVRMLLIHMINIFKYFNKWGWIFDSGRRKLNEKTLRLISES